MNSFNYQVRVYYDSTDAGGVVYHSKYLDFCERARTEFLRSKGVIQSKLFQEKGIGFVVHKATLEYQKPAKLDDLLDITVDIISNNGVILKMEQNVFLISRDDKSIEKELLFHIIVDIVCINSSHRAVRIPKDICGILNK